jgi:hypothetical protein
MYNSDQLGYQKQNSSDMHLFIAKSSKNILFASISGTGPDKMYLTNTILYNFKG